MPAHNDFLVERLHPEHFVVARQGQLVGTQGGTLLIDGGKLSLLLCHFACGSFKGGEPFELSGHEGLSLFDGGRCRGHEGLFFV